MKKKLLFLTIPIALVLVGAGCEPTAPVSTSGIKKATTNVQKQQNGLTVEQQNIKDRLEQDNKPGSIKHLYVISAYSGQTLIYSTVRGKVTSSGKRLSPVTVADRGDSTYAQGFNIDFNGETKVTNEVLQDDGSYGSSIEYIYWWDTKGIYHQHYITGGEIVHISSEPIAVKSVILNLSQE